MLPREVLMNGLDIRLEEVNQRLVLRLAGTLDGRTARAVIDALRDLPPVPLTVDFSQVRTFVDLSVDALTRALRDRPVSLRGLGRHQARMFRYFGLGSEESEHSAEA
ncbi:MAG: STAS domain-containing protein [Myxococcaceae bacterium]